MMVPFELTPLMIAMALATELGKKLADEDLGVHASALGNVVETKKMATNAQAFKCIIE